MCFIVLFVGRRENDQEGMYFGTLIASCFIVFLGLTIDIVSLSAITEQGTIGCAGISFCYQNQVKKTRIFDY